MHNLVWGGKELFCISCFTRRTLHVWDFPSCVGFQCIDESFTRVFAHYPDYRTPIPRFSYIIPFSYTFHFSYTIFQFWFFVHYSCYSHINYFGLWILVCRTIFRFYVPDLTLFFSFCYFFRVSIFQVCVHVNVGEFLKLTFLLFLGIFFAFKKLNF